MAIRNNAHKPIDIIKTIVSTAPTKKIGSDIPISPKLVPQTGHSNTSNLSTKDFLKSFQLKDSDIIKSLKPKEYNV